jgi:hypothetical protein
MSIKKFSLIAAAATVAVLAMATSASANNGATLNVTKADPVTNITAGKPQSGGLYLDVVNCQPSDTSCTGSNGVSPTQVSDGVYGQDISWSKEVTIGKSKQPVCNSATISALTYENALKACNGSLMGLGGATVCLGGVTPGTACSAVQAKALVFKAPDFTDPGLFGAPGKIYPQLNLYADIGVGVAVIPAVIVTPTKANKTAGYSKTLHVFGSGPHVSPPSQSITDFWANVNYGVKTKCGLAGQTGSVNILYQGEWDTDATAQGTVDKTDNKTQACSFVP